MIFNIFTPGDNIYICYYLCAAHNGSSSGQRGFCPQGENLYDCASVKSMLIVALIGAPRWESGVIISEQNSRPLSRTVTVFFISTRSKSYQNLAFSSVFVIKSRRRI